MQNTINRFNSAHALRKNLECDIEEMETAIQEYSNLLGQKIRVNEESSANDPDFLALKAKLDDDSSEISDGKKPSGKKTQEKKKKSKKGTSDKWYNLKEILVYDGIGLKGELELYFKATDELKSKLEDYQRTLTTLNGIIEKGLKEDMGCVVFRGAKGPLEVAFLKSTTIRPNYSLKSIYTGAAIPVENGIKIGE